MASEIWQFLMLAVGFFVVALLWVFVVYLPGRTMERWEDKRTNRPRDRSGGRRLQRGACMPSIS